MERKSLAPLKGLVPEDDYLLHQLPESFAVSHSDSPKVFERLYFNLHDRHGKLLMVAGFGVFPNASVADAYVVVRDAAAQRNVRLARELGGSRLDTSVGPLKLSLLEPMQRWRLQMEETEGISFDVTFEARSVAYSVGIIRFPPETAFSHYNQAGTYSGRLTIDGESVEDGGWIGQRDHSWGLRRATEGNGLHYWLISHFEDRTVMVSYNETRQHEVNFCEGAVMFYDERPPIAVTDLRHELELAENRLQAHRGRFKVLCEDGEELAMSFEPTLGDLYMSGCGYGGWQGQHRGELHVEHERWPGDAMPVLKEQSFTTVDQLAAFECGGERGVGVLEYGISRSSSYSYRPRW
ncbi:MAG: hypothetical protein U0R71_10975 [Solirubrobacterales bacterium]